MKPDRAARVIRLAAVALCAACAVPNAANDASDRAQRPFRIAVVDVDTRRGIPAVELQTTDRRRFYTDSAGVVAFDERDLMGQPVWLRATSFGYTPVEAEAQMSMQPGGSGRIEMRRLNVAQRLYRVTGSGIYSESARLGDTSPPSHEREPGVPAMGMDSAQAIEYRGELFWIWGDTTWSSTPLGNYRASGATSALPEAGGLDPERGILLRYFRSEGRTRPMVDDPHPVIWLSALRVADASDGDERLFATYSKIGAGMEELERGLVELDDEANVFRIVAVHGDGEPAVPHGHSFRVEDDREGGHLYTDLDVRSRADAASVRDLASYEAFTALRPAHELADGAAAVERDAAGTIVWKWRRGAAPIAPEDWQAYVEAGHARPEDGWYRLVDVASGLPVTPHRGSVHWNAYRGRWIMIRNELDAPESFLGEVWYFEGDTLQGPWAYGQKILTHGPLASSGDEPEMAGDTSYSFYNPTHHPELDRDGGRKIFFEGTFSSTFARNATAVPGYDYNQLMHMLELDDPRLFLPVAVYRLEDSDRLLTRDDLASDPQPRRLAFFAPDRPRAGTVAVRESLDGAGRPRLTLGGERGRDGEHGEIRFYCAPDGDGEPAATATLFEIRAEGGEVSYGTFPPAGADATPLCRVWPRVVDFDPTAPGPPG